MTKLHPLNKTTYSCSHGPPWWRLRACKLVGRSRRRRWDRCRPLLSCSRPSELDLPKSVEARRSSKCTCRWRKILVIIWHCHRSYNLLPTCLCVSKKTYELHRQTFRWQLNSGHLVPRIGKLPPSSIHCAIQQIQISLVLSDNYCRINHSVWQGHPDGFWL